jgi:hypothetical protein
LQIEKHVSGRFFSKFHLRVSIDIPGHKAVKSMDKGIAGLVRAEFEKEVSPVETVVFPPIFRIQTNLPWASKAALPLILRMKREKIPPIFRIQMNLPWASKAALSLTLRMEHWRECFAGMRGFQAISD